MPTPPDSPRVLLFSTVYPPFIADDERMLRRHFRVEKKISAGFRALVTLPFAVLRNRVVLSWFGSVYAGYNTLLARLFGKISIIVLAGVDASKEPEINYGIWLSPWKSLVMRYTFRYADRLLVVDPSLGREARRLARYEGFNIEYIPFGFEPAEWAPGDGIREQVVLTVASCENEWRLKKKGIDKLLAAARELHGVRFRLIGIHPPLLEKLKDRIPANVEAIPFVPRSELASYYRRAKVYCQPSFTEGLPNTLCEAMLCGCIPVGTNAGGIPTAIGDAGYLVEYRDQPGLVDALRRALAAKDGVGREATKRIMSLFPLERRETALAGAINAMAEAGRGR